MNEREIAEALAAQEEHIKRTTSCEGRVGLPHSWDAFSPAPDKPTYQACWRCRVTKTAADYALKTGSGVSG